MRKPTNMIQAQMKTNLVSTSATVSTGALVDATSAYKINNGEVAILEADVNSANYGDLTATPTGKFVQLVQGTPKSNNVNNVDLWGISDPAVVRSNNIYPKTVRSMTSGIYNSGNLGSELYTTDTVFAANSDYGIFFQLDGRRQEREFGHNTDILNGSVTTPATLPTDAKDFVFQDIAAKINSQSILLGSSKRIVVLGIKIAGGAGTAISTLVNDNSAIDFMTKNGVTYTMQSSTELIRSLALQISLSTLTAASTIEVIDVTTAGDAAKVDALLVVGLDADIAAYDDDVMQVRTEVTINPKDELESEGTIVSVYPKEATNSGRHIANLNRHRAQLDIHTKQNEPFGERFSEGYTYIDPKKNYGSFIVDFYDTEDTYDAQYVYEKQATVYWEQTEPITLSVDGVEIGQTAVLAFTPAETAPTVVSQFTTWVNANA